MTVKRSGCDEEHEWHVTALKETYTAEDVIDHSFSFVPQNAHHPGYQHQYIIFNMKPHKQISRPCTPPKIPTTTSLPAHLHLKPPEISS